MNCLSDRYKSKDPRYSAAKAVNAVIEYAINNLADGQGGTITLLPVDEFENIHVIYCSKCGDVEIGQVCVHDNTVTSVAIPVDRLRLVLTAICQTIDQ